MGVTDATEVAGAAEVVVGGAAADAFGAVEEGAGDVEQPKIKIAIKRNNEIRANFFTGFLLSILLNYNYRAWPTFQILQTRK
jgi:hypothetical protein